MRYDSYYVSLWLTIIDEILNYRTNYLLRKCPKKAIANK